MSVSWRTDEPESQPYELPPASRWWGWAFLAVVGVGWIVATLRLLGAWEAT